MIITIDGPASSGKGTVAKIIAAKLGYNYLDSGAIYRAVAWVMLQKNIVATDKVKITVTSEIIAKTLDLINEIKLTFKDNKVFLNELDVTNHLRNEEVGMLASNIASIHEIRLKLLEFQRFFSQGKGLVTDGRDMGSVVFPNANLKIYLTSDAEIRAKRRFLELQKSGKSATIADILADIKARDLRDQSRKSAPLAYDESYVVLDNSNLTIEETVKQIISKLN